MIDVAVIGGGASGVFAAIAAKTAHPECRVVLLEKSAVLLAKVKVSGGGRCNVTHACFDPQALIKHYPRGSRELLGPFHRFQPTDTVAWFQQRGVALKTEDDGRMFPVTDRSETIIECLLKEAREKGVEIFLRQHIESLTKEQDGFTLTLREGNSLKAQRLILATGSQSQGHAWACAFGHHVEEPVPSLFTFNVPTSPLKELSGISLESAEVQLVGSPYRERGSLLITHFGFSGFAVLRLSAWGARFLYERQYRTLLAINWLPNLSFEEIENKLIRLKKEAPQKCLVAENLFGLPRNLWKALIPESRLNDLALAELRALAQKLHADTYCIEGKTTHKEEFVTCGGVALKEVDFRTMESKICPGLYFAGEILDIDGVTGGFNFQSAWTTGWIAGSSATTHTN